MTPILNVGSDVHLSSQNILDLSAGETTLMLVNQLRLCRRNDFGRVGETTVTQARNAANTHLRLVFSTVPSCSQMPMVFYYSVIHSLGFFICEIKYQKQLIY